MARHLIAVAALVWIDFSMPNYDCSAAPYRLEGVGTLSGSPPYGVAGENVTVTIDLDPDDFTYVSVANPAFHYFEPTQTVPINLVGATSGPFPNVDPINRVLALELTGSPSSVDQVAIDNGTTGVTTVFKSFCDTANCFDGDAEPFTPDEMFDLIGRSIKDTAQWTTSFANIFLGGSEDIVLLNNVAWTFRDLSAGTRSVDIQPTFDARFTPGSVYSLEEGATSIVVGEGFSAQLPERRAILEFPLGDIPANAVITSASLEFDPYVSSGTPRLEILGYAGDGLASLRDGALAGQVLEVTTPVSVSTGMSFDLDLSFIQSLLGTASHLGVRLRSLDLPQYIGFLTSESGSASPKPTLTVEFSSGDFDNDDDVDGLDFLKWQRGESPNTGSAAELEVWESLYGTIYEPLTAASTPVPEPRAAVLALVGALAFAGRSRDNRSSSQYHERRQLTAGQRHR